MRSGRSFLVLLAIALGLGAYIYFVEADREPTDTPAKAKVFPEVSGLIDEVEIRAESGAVTRVKRDGSTWKILEPAGLEGDTAQIATLVTALDTLEAERTVDENPASVGAYGLEPPRFTVAYRKEGQPTMQRLQVGSKTPTGSDLYARVEGQSKVVLIASYHESSLNRTTFDLRDKAVLKFAREGVTSVQLQGADGPPRTMTKQGDEWRLTSPVAARADAGAIDGLIGQIAQMQMKTVVAEDGTSELKTYGLDRPQATATIGLGSTRAALALGAKTADGSALYARDLSRPVIFTVEPSALDDLGKNLDALRMKDLFAFRSFNAVSVTFTYNGQTFTFAKTTTPAATPPGDAAASPPPPTEVWRQTAPAAADVDQGKITELLSLISNLRAESFTDKPLATGDELVVVARFGDAAKPTEERAAFRHSGAVVHGTVPGEPGAALVRTEDFTNALTQLKALVGIK